MAHFSVKNPMGKEEVDDASERPYTPLGDSSENIPPESGGSDTGGIGESKLSSTGTGGEQTNTSDNVGGLGDASADAPSQNTADGAGSTTSKPSTKKGAKPTGE